MKVLSAGLSDIGNTRSVNEDTILLKPELGLYLVCDGVGGHQGGQMASKTAATVIERELKKHSEFIQKLRSRNMGVSLSTAEIQQLQKFVEQAVEAACLEINQKSRTDSNLRGMATTVDAILFVGDHAILGHVGDSRIYLYRSRKLHQLTEDHSVASEMAKQGVIPTTNVKQSPYAHVLSRAVGFESAVQVDTLAAELMPGDVFLLCTDGLHEFFNEKDAHQLFQKNTFNETELKSLTQTLIEASKSRGSKDNISAVILGVTDFEAEEPTDKIELKLTPEIKVEVVKNIPLFQHLSYSEIVKILTIAQKITFKPDETLIVEGTVGAEMFVILSGHIEIVSKNVVIGTRTRGALLGEMAIIDLAPRSATIKAMKENVEALMLTRDQFFQLLRAEPRLAVKILWSLCSGLNSRLRETTERLVELENLEKTGSNTPPGKGQTFPFAQ